MVDLFLFVIWCASIAGDMKTYMVAAESKDAALATVDYFMRQDWEIHYASKDEAVYFGAIDDGEDVVVFDDKFFKYNSKEKRFELDCWVNYEVRPDLKTIEITNHEEWVRFLDKELN